MFTPGFVGRSNCGVEYRINSLGLRDRERDYLQPGGRRVLALGNSFAMGAGEAFADTFLAKLEDELRRRDGECEVVKAGIGGYGTRHELGYYREFGRRYKARAVLVLFFVGTDFRNNMAERRGRVHKGKLVPTYPYSRLNRFMKYLETHSGLYNAMLYVLRSNDFVRGALHRRGLIRCAYPQHVSMYRRDYGDDQQLSMEQTLAALGDFKRACAEDDCQFLLCVVPDRLQVEDEYFARYIGWLGERPDAFDREKPNRLLTDYCRAEGIPSIDLREDFRHLRSGGERVYLDHDIHWDEAGRAAAVRSVAPRLDAMLGAADPVRTSAG